MMRTVLFLAALLAAAAPVAASPAGPVVVPRSSGHALLIWQATPFVAALASKHESKDQALAELESAALTVIAEHKALLHKASSVSLKVLYVRTAAQNDPQYAPTSFAGFTQLLILTVTKTALANSAKWPRVTDPRRLPAGVSATVTGSING